VADPKTRTEAIAWVQRQLGGGVVVLEVSDEHVEDAWDTAKRWYVGRKGIIRHAAQNLTPGVQEYTMPEDTDEVLDVIFPGVQLDIIAAVNPYAFIDVDQIPVAYASITGVPGGQFYGTLHQILAHAETARRVVGSEPAWEWHQDTNTLFIAPRNQRTGTVVVRYISTTLRDEVATDDFGRLRFRDREIILRMGVAQLKGLLGRVRSKYNEWPSAGGTKSMDGTDLLTESQAEIETLNEEIKELSRAVPFLVG